MSSNFLNTSGFFVGVDPHVYYFFPPLWPPGVDPAQPHVVGALHDWEHDGEVVETVTTSGAPVLQTEWKMKWVPHVPVPIPAPHPLELAWLPVIIFLMSSSEPELSAHKVTGKGKPLLVEDFEAVGVNLDCSDAGIGLGADINFNSVKTQPTLGDYLGSLAKFAFHYLLGKVKLPKKWTEVEEKAEEEAEEKVKKPLSKAVMDAIKNQLTKQALENDAKRGLDKGFDKGKDMFEDWASPQIGDFVQSSVDGD